jgi:very-short-patch-repair endonuclease
MRHEQTETEKALWRLLRDRRLAKMKWRRQFPIGRYIVDFVCLDHRIIVECDGSQRIALVRFAARPLIPPERLAFRVPSPARGEGVLT